MKLNEFLLSAVKKGASDIHFKAGSPPILRIYGDIVKIKSAPMTPQAMNSLAFTFINEAKRRNFRSFTEMDTTYTIPNEARFRVNIYRQKGTFAIAMRHIPLKLPSMEQLRIPEVAKRFAMEPRGLVIVTGVTGSGKSTTLASMINYINMHKRSHIITIEDPIEFIHEDIKSVVNQREVGTDTPSFLSALRAAMRENPDVIMVGEMRDTDTIATVLRASETGHLVLTTFHTTDAKETITSIVSYFPPHQQQQVRAQLAANLKGIISQRLIKRKDGLGRVLASEVLVNSPTIRACILDPARIDEIPEHMSRGTSEYGMQTFDQAVMHLYKEGLISYESALANATSPAEFERAIQFG
jgi:twitching motility protein PilT